MIQEIIDDPDIPGNKILKYLHNEKLELGRYSVTFDAGRYASGIYFYQLKTTEFNEVKKMLLVK